MKSRSVKSIAVSYLSIYIIGVAFLFITLAPSCPASKSAEYYVNYGKHCMSEGDHIEAQRSFTRAIKLQPSYFEAFTERAKAWEASDSLVRAIADYDSLLSFKGLTVDQTAGLLFNRANMHYLLSDDVNACRDWRKACELNHNKACDLIRKRCK